MHLSPNNSAIPGVVHASVGDRTRAAKAHVREASHFAPFAVCVRCAHHSVLAYHKELLPFEGACEKIFRIPRRRFDLFGNLFLFCCFQFALLTFYF
jgi:hypothetical protein